jgi:transcriptional regulator with XRE-family HTH domain
LPELSTIAEPNRLREEMRRQRLSFRDLAFLTGHSAGYLCHLATGRRRPSRESALRIAKALHVAPARLWGPS